MNYYDKLSVFLFEPGVFALADEKPYGIEAYYFLDGVSYKSSYHPHEFQVIGTVDLAIGDLEFEWFED